MPNMLLRFGVLIEGVDETELPEQMLFCTYLNCMNIVSDASIDSKVAAFIANPSNMTPAI